MSLNHSKCGLLRITRNSQPIHYSYNVEGNLLKTINKQKDIAVIVSKDLKWSLNVQAVSNKANKMLGFVKRSCFHESDPKVQKTLYLTLVGSQLGYCSQVWAPQTTHDIQTLERVQRLFHFKQIFHTLKDLLSSTFFQLPTGMNTWILFIYSNVFMKIPTNM